MKSRLVDEIRRACKQEKASLARHALLREASSATPSKARVLRWVKCARHDSREFLELLRRLVKVLRALLAQNPPNKQELEAILEKVLENLQEEEGVNENNEPDETEAHYLHYIELARQLGLSEEDLDAYEVGAGVRVAIALARNAPSWPLGRIIGYLLGNEELTPVVYDPMGQAVSRRFPKVVTKFFWLHVQVDVEHVKALYEIVALLPDDDFEEVLLGVRLGARGMGVLLDEAAGYVDAA